MRASSLLRVLWSSIMWIRCWQRGHCQPVVIGQEPGGALLAECDTCGHLYFAPRRRPSPEIDGFAPPKGGS